ncbi:hypothetical protein AMTRI_Chr07g27720 [Amborella trichopoda]
MVFVLLLLFVLALHRDQWIYFLPEFCRNLGVSISSILINLLCVVLQAANYLNVKTLLDKTCRTIADRVKDWSVEEIRKNFEIENDFSPEEGAQVRKDNQWAFE